MIWSPLVCSLVSLLLYFFVVFGMTLRFWALCLDLFLLFLSFKQNTLDKDVHHIDALTRLRDVQVTFEIFFSCFTQKNS
jgi:hypothetical protein